MTFHQSVLAILGEYHDLLKNRGEVFRARAYKQAEEAIVSQPISIQSSLDMKTIKGVGSTIMEKIQEFEKTGIIKSLEVERAHPIHKFVHIYGVGPKKANELVQKGA